ncbi:ABC transporter six-transmembrane domain-containing protein [Neisseria perflava]|uniref:ABC transporter six-transmembrane domain-containing protein n=1 Tax=Neisseria perflava TaxID=33053 RepID=UPI00209E9128|nr:ABC transporter six-transmembrane domain-containing protein [Neisseria perflava]MCP1659428.1 ABC-type multidrug transport system fused ATPase/permease subunit [Neisseria perflava]MCP1772268.1 ABC-type multidrug transport system fused ATPase/permease subunit [Neisseria perflava]
MSALNNLITLSRQHKKKLAGTFALVVTENLLLVLYPLFGAFAIDGVMAGNVMQALTYAAVVLVMWLIGSARRAVDTRTFTHIYARMVVPVIIQQRGSGEATSSVSARVALSRELVDFFEQHLPTLLTSGFSVIGAVVMLLVLEPWAGLTAAAILGGFGLLVRRFAATNDRLYFSLNNRLERDVALIQNAHPDRLERHYDLVSWLRVKISDREATGYLLIGLAMALLFGVTLTVLTLQNGVSAGHIYAVVSYLWAFAMSLDDFPQLLERFSAIKDIGKRVQVAR